MTPEDQGAGKLLASELFLLYALQRYSSKGGDLASTWVTKPKVHAEVQCPRKSRCKLLVANDDNYALAA